MTRKGSRFGIDRLAAAGLVAFSVAVAGCGGDEPDERGAPAVEASADLLKSVGLTESQLAPLEANVRELIVQSHRKLVDAPDQPDRWYELGVVLHANEFNERAAKCYRFVLGRDAQRARAWYYLGLIQVQSDQSAEAIGSFVKVQSLEPKFAPGFWRAGRAQLEIGRIEDAVQSYTKAKAIAPNDAAAWIGLGRAYLENKQYAEAATALESALPRMPENAAYVNLLLATAYRQLDRMDDAAAAAAQAGDVRPMFRDPWEDELARWRPGQGARINYAQSLVDAHKYPQALSLLEEIRKTDPDNLAVLSQLGLCYRMQGRVDESVAVLERALEVNEGYFAAHYLLSVSLVAQSQMRGKPELRARAVDHVERALVLNPAYAAAYAVRGDIHGMDGEPDAAVRLYAEAIRCDNADPRWHTRLGMLHIRREQWAPAVEPLRRSLAIYAEQPEAARALTTAYIMIAQYEDALTVLRDAVNRWPANQQFREALHELESQRGGG